MNFPEMVHRATGFDPYPYQQRLADDGLPELLRAPTGSGKTVAAVLPWLYRRRYHPDPTVRKQTPHWLVLALPLRTLVDQTEGQVAGWLDKLGIGTEVGLHVLMGGRTDEAGSWADHTEQDAVLIGSIDMLLSRAMNRGYASSRFRWPMDFGVFNSGTQWVFDEVQLFGPALPTSRQLQALRERFGTYLPSSSMWMSATVSPEWLETVDAPSVGTMVEISDDDRRGPLGSRTSATREIRELTETESPASIAAAIVERHRPGTRTICFVNTVASARDLHKALESATDAEVVLVHSRFRPADRAHAAGLALDESIGETGRIIVTTQAFEAGVDVTSTTMFTEAAPWTSIVQRVGRCNRYGETDEAALWWYEPNRPEPYDDVSIKESVAALRSLEGHHVTGEGLAGFVAEARPYHPVLRRRDIVDLFDTTPALTGEDIDISQYIRGDTERDVFIAWRDLSDDGPDPSLRLRQEELCRASLKEARAWVKKLAEGTKKKPSTYLWRFDLERGEWIRVRGRDLHPGLVVLADVTAGGYTPDGGWNVRSAVSVPPVPEEPTTIFEIASDEDPGADPLSQLGSWVTLSDHLEDTRRELRSLMSTLGSAMPPAISKALETAAYLHDIGKAHPVFQDMLLASAGDDEHPDRTVVWAKSSRARRARPTRQGFRHELVSEVMLAHAPGLLPDEADLIRYLVAAHHGKIRLAVRPNEHDADLGEDGRPAVLGIVDGEMVSEVHLEAGVTIPETEMEVASLPLMGGEGSWTRLALTLRDRDDLGPFRLAWLEALVRLADWKASAHPSRAIDVHQEVTR